MTQSTVSSFLRNAYILLMLITTMGFYSSGAYAVDCPMLPKNGDAREIAIAEMAGKAIVFQSNNNIGIQSSTYCLANLFDVDESQYPANDQLIAIALLSIMTIDPSRFFSTLERLPSRAVERWVGPALKSSEIEHIAECVTPDRFEQARRALSGLKLNTRNQREIYSKVVFALKPLKCRVP